MDDDLFDDFEPDRRTADPDAPPAAPDYRATVVNHRVTLISWMPFLLSGPGAQAAFREREHQGVTVADLTTMGEGLDREVIVEFLAQGGGADAEKALARWAEHTGHRRIWFPDRVVTFDECPPLRRAHVKCRGCGHRFEEHRAPFWVSVHASGQFPNYCLLCGHDLPQWTVSTRS